MKNLKNINKSKGHRPEKPISSIDRKHEIALENALKKMKQIIAALSVVIIICIVWIAYLIINQKHSSPLQNQVISNAPAVENSNTPTTEKTSEPNPVQTQTPGLYNMPAGSQQGSAPVMVPAMATSNANNSTTAPAQKTAPGMNPPHGQPGHRCDIAVGAPLNSPPAKTTTSPVNPLPANNNPLSITPANNSTNPMIDIKALPDTSIIK